MSRLAACPAPRLLIMPVNAFGWQKSKRGLSPLRGNLRGVFGPNPVMTQVLSPRQRYEQDLAAGVLLPDSAQASVIADFDALCIRLIDAPRASEQCGRERSVSSVAVSHLSWGCISGAVLVGVKRI